MKILVCISHVPDTTSKINFVENNTQFDTQGVQYIINPNDEFGLTRAIWFKEKEGATVDVINVGGTETESTLRKALAIGADNAIRINTEAQDATQVAKEIVEVIQENPYDLIIAGRESIDYNGGMVPGMIAALTGMNYLNNCIHIEIKGRRKQLQCEKWTEESGTRKYCFNTIYAPIKKNCFRTCHWSSKRIGRRKRFTYSQHERDNDGSQTPFRIERPRTQTWKRPCSNYCI